MSESSPLDASRIARRPAGPWAIAGVAAVLSPAVLAAPAHAVTVPPGVTVVDEAGVLSSAEESQLQSRLSELRRETGEGLYVIYVDAFGSGGAAGLVRDVQSQRNLGTSDSILAIEVEERSYQFARGARSDTNVGQEITAAYIGPLMPELGSDDWLAPALAAADGVDDAADGSVDGVGASGTRYEPAGALPQGAGTGTTTSSGDTAGTVATVGAVGLGVGAAGYLAWTLARRRREKDGTGSSAVAMRTPQQVDPLDKLSIEELKVKAGSLLVGADDAIRTSEQELGFAEAGYGAASVETFRQDIAAAKEHMRASFQLQRQLEDDVPDTEDEQRAWLKEIIGRSTKVGEVLSEHEQEFAALRDMENHVPDTLERIDSELPQARERVQSAEALLVRLHERYTDTALAEVTENADEARERLEFVVTAEDKARAAWGEGDRSTAALAVRAAEEGLGQVRTLVSAVEKSESTLEQAMMHLDQGLAQSEQDVAEAEAIVSQGRDQDLAGPAAGLRTVMRSVREALQGGRVDPQELLHRLEDAHRQLNVPLSSVRDARINARNAAQQLPAAQRQAQSEFDGTYDYIAARRGAVGSQARARLADAERLLDESRQYASSDPQRALDAAQQAAHQSEQASELARRDVAVFGFRNGHGSPLDDGYGYGQPRQRQSSGFGAGLGGAMLGGIIINSLLGGGGSSGSSDWGGGGFGGMGGGGLSGGDFGGFGDLSGGGF
ncbi:MAG: TPM domain-containing protein [Micrococcus sp.]|nr:TPM domain-containing protein [Micrococcus sp.]